MVSIPERDHLFSNAAAKKVRNNPSHPIWWQPWYKNVWLRKPEKKVLVVHLTSDLNDPRSILAKSWAAFLKYFWSENCNGPTIMTNCHFIQMIRVHNGHQNRHIVRKQSLSGDWRCEKWTVISRNWTHNLTLNVLRWQVNLLTSFFWLFQSPGKVAE